MNNENKASIYIDNTEKCTYTYRLQKYKVILIANMEKKISREHTEVKRKQCKRFIRNNENTITKGKNENNNTAKKKHKNGK